MRAFLVGALLVLGAIALLPTAAEAQPIGACTVTSFDPATGDGTAVCGPYYCRFGPDNGGIRCFG